MLLVGGLGCGDTGGQAAPDAGATAQTKGTREGEGTTDAPIGAGFDNVADGERPALEPQPEATTAGDGQGPVVEACRALESRAQGLPVKQSDLIIVLDNSGSMADEIGQVRDNLNGLAAALSDSDVESHVVMISAALDTTAWLGVCIPAPLGSGSCPDDHNPPGYFHVTEHVLDSEPPIVTDIFVQSTALLDHLMYSFSQYRHVLRDGVSKNIVVITDHDSVLGAEYFTAWMDRQREFRANRWRLHAVVCLDDSCAEPGVWAGRRVGTVYRDLAEQTGGVAVQITGSSFGQIFDMLASDIVDSATPLPCDWGIPTAPDGRTLDPDQVNVRFTGPDGSEQTILGLREASDCELTGGGWYYDDPQQPTRIAVCEQTCRVIALQTEAKVEIEFGCERQWDPRLD